MNVKLLQAIADASAANTKVYVGPADGKPLMDAGLISVDFNDKQGDGDTTQFAATITEAGVAKLASGSAAQSDKPAGHAFNVMSGIVLPKIKRGGGGFKKGPSKYPFDTLEIGQFFFVANSDVESGEAVKTMSSAVGAANQRFMEPTGEKKEVTRAKRAGGKGNKALIGADGKKVMETVTVDVKRSLRHFTCRPVQSGVKYGDWTAPADGAVIVREEVK